MVPDAIHIQTFNLRRFMVIAGEGQVEVDPERIEGAENRWNVRIRGTTLSYPGDRLWLVRTDTEVDSKDVDIADSLRGQLATKYRDWVHQSPMTQCGVASDTCPDWQLAFELADIAMTVMREYRG